MRVIRALVQFRTRKCEGKPELLSGLITVRHEVDAEQELSTTKAEIEGHVRAMLPVVEKVNVGLILPDEEVVL